MTEHRTPDQAATDQPAALLTIAEASAYLHVTRSTMNRIVAAGDLPVVRLPGRTDRGVIRFRRTTLDAYLTDLEAQQ